MKGGELDIKVKTLVYLDIEDFIFIVNDLMKNPLTFCKGIKSTLTRCRFKVASWRVCALQSLRRFTQALLGAFQGKVAPERGHIFFCLCSSRSNVFLCLCGDKNLYFFLFFPQFKCMFDDCTNQILPASIYAIVLIIFPILTLTNFDVVPSRLDAHH